MQERSSSQGEFPQGVFRLRSAERSQHFTQHICLRMSADSAYELYIGPAFAAAAFWAEPVPKWPGGSTLAVHCPHRPELVPMYLSTPGDSARVDLWNGVGPRQTWLAAPGKQAGQWHFTVQGGNSSDHDRTQLSCGLGDSDQEAVDLWHDHVWSLYPAMPSCKQTQDCCPTGYFYFQSATRTESGQQHQWLGLRDKAESLQQLKMVNRDSAVLVHLAPVYGSTKISIQVFTKVPWRYMSAQGGTATLQLAQTVQESDSKVWSAAQAEIPKAGWILSISNSQKVVHSRLALSCGLQASDEEVNLAQHHCWFVEPSHGNTHNNCVLQ